MTSLPDKHYSLDSEDDFAPVLETSVLNNSSSQNYPHLDHHNIKKVKDKQIACNYRE